MQALPNQTEIAKREIMRCKEWSCAKETGQAPSPLQLISETHFRYGHAGLQTILLLSEFSSVQM